MEKHLEKLKEYLKMETEIPFSEFKIFYQDVLDTLNTEYNDFDQPACLQARYICSIVQANAQARSKKDRDNKKAFRKMADKTAFWVEAIDHRLKKEGLSQVEIEQVMTELNDPSDN